MTELEKIKKYEAMGVAKQISARLRKYVMIAQEDLKKACIINSKGEYGTEMTWMNCEEVYEQIHSLCADIQELHSSMISEFNDVYVTAYGSVCIWWHEILFNFENFMGLATNDKYPANAIQKVVASGRKFLSIAIAGREKLAEWKTSNPFTDYL